jgi:hypothetical protein
MYISTTQVKNDYNTRIRGARATDIVPRCRNPRGIRTRDWSPPKLCFRTFSNEDKIRQRFAETLLSACQPKKMNRA